MSQKLATVILPTTGDRGPLLPYSVGSIQNQTIKDIEIFIIGDGVNNATRKKINQLLANDDRIKFFDHPKHPRRGEEYRHHALQEASGRTIFYLCDRDLMLPNYVENVIKNKNTYNLFISSYYTIEKDKSVVFSLFKEDLFICTNTYKNLSKHRQNSIWRKLTGVRLSSMSHTLEFYNSLPFGWRTTPEDQYTDVYMARQMLNSANCKLLLNIQPPAFLYFSRGQHPGWPTHKRKAELKFWYGLIIKKKYREIILFLFQLLGIFFKIGNKVKKLLFSLGNI